MSHHYFGPSIGFPHGDARLDLTDLYAFPTPGNVGKSILIMIMNVHPSSGLGPPGQTSFEPFATDALYEFKIASSRMRAEKRRAVVFFVRNCDVFFVIVGLSDNHPHPIPGFVLAFSTAMFVCDTITAILLFAVFASTLAGAFCDRQWIRLHGADFDSLHPGVSRCPWT